MKEDGYWQWSGPAVCCDEDLTTTDLCRGIGGDLVVRL